jgi:hypothetical protein
MNISKIICSALILLTFSISTFANFSIEGHYQGKQIYVQSPTSSDGFGFCINKVSLNGEPIAVDIYSSAFEIDLGSYDLSIGDKVLIVFEHENGCKPKLLNPEVLLPLSTYQLEYISYTSDGNLTWSTTLESGELDFQIQQFKWNKWVNVGRVSGVGTPELNNYLFKLTPHSGENKVRLVQTDNTGQKRYSKEVVFTPENVIAPELVLDKSSRKIYFKAENKLVKTKYEMFDTFGNILKKGYNNELDNSNLKPGVYYVNYDNKHEKIILP